MKWNIKGSRWISNIQVYQCTLNIFVVPSRSIQNSSSNSEEVFVGLFRDLFGVMMTSSSSSSSSSSTVVFEGGDDETSVGLVTLFFFTEEEGFFVRGGGTGVYEEKNNTHL